MTCATRRELVERFSEAVSVYTRATSRLRAEIGTLCAEEYNALFHLTQNAKTFADKAYAAIIQHEKEHGCEKLTNPHSGL